MQIQSSAPGSLMLLGEYAVLYGRHAVVCAVDKRIHVTLTPRQDQIINIYSALGEYTTSLDQLAPNEKFRFVLAVVNFYRKWLTLGCDIEIKADFSHQVGFGSSAAVTVAVSAAIAVWLNQNFSALDLVKQARHVVRTVQGTGSGADVAASVYGGIIDYNPQPLTVEKFAHLHDISVIYSGFKTPTVDAIKAIQSRFSSHPNIFRIIINAIGQCATEGAALIRSEDWQGLGKLFALQQGLMVGLGVNLPQLQQCLDYLQQNSSIIGAKISGSGLGDCVIGLGNIYNSPAAPLPEGEIIPVNMTLQGVSCEKV